MITSLAQSPTVASITQIVGTFDSQVFASLLIQIPEASDGLLGFLTANHLK